MIHRLLRWYFVEADDTGYEAAAEVIARAMANIAPGTPNSATVPVPAIEACDLLDDLDAVLGSWIGLISHPKQRGDLQRSVHYVNRLGGSSVVSMFRPARR